MSLILFNVALEKIIRGIPVSHEMELNDKNIILVYADDIEILGSTENDVVKVTEKLIGVSSMRIKPLKGKFYRKSIDQYEIKIGNMRREKTQIWKGYIINQVLVSEGKTIGVGQPCLVSW